MSNICTQNFHTIGPMHHEYLQVCLHILHILHIKVHPSIVNGFQETHFDTTDGSQTKAQS